MFRFGMQGPADNEDVAAREGVEPDDRLFSATLCCSLNDLRDSGWPPKSLKSR
jgi:hypothetical protein